MHFVRENRKFDSKEALIEQIGKDKQFVLNKLKQEKRNGAPKRAESTNRC